MIAAALVLASLAVAGPAQDCGPHDGLSFICGPVGAEDIAATIDFIVHLDPSAAINEVLIRPARQGF